MGHFIHPFYLQAAAIGKKMLDNVGLCDRMGGVRVMDPLHCLKCSRAGESLRGCFLFVLRINVFITRQ